MIAKGVEFDVMDKGEGAGVQIHAEVHVAHAKKEVLLCAGTIKSPQVIPNIAIPLVTSHTDLLRSSPSSMCPCLPTSVKMYRHRLFFVATT